MDPRTQERVEQWDSRPFGGGYDELATLSENGFSGAVTAAGVWLFMLNGRVVGVVDGEIEDFEHATGTVHAAPDPALPLLCSMRERGGDRRGRYYTNETPLSEVDDTLQSGSFTGYVELSEQVLSGDYYLVYYGGRRMAVAFIGNAERLLTGDEAFERADDEVGIYEVVDVAVEVTDVPTPEPLESESTSEPTADPEPTPPGSTSTPTEPESAPAGSEPADAESTSESTADGARDTFSADDERTTMSDDARPASAADLREAADLSDVSDSTPTDPSAFDEPPSDDRPAVDGVASDSGPDRESETAPDPDPSESADPTEPAADESEPASAFATDAAAEDDRTTDDDRTEDDAPDQSRNETTADATGAAAAIDEAEGDGSTADAKMDPERVEAAAAKLDERGIDWSADDAPADEPPTDDEPPADGEAPEPDDGAVDERLKREERWRETRSIPSIDPAKTSADESRTRRRPAGTSRSSSTGETGGTPLESVQSGGSTTGSGDRRSDAESAESAESAASAPERETDVRELRERLEEATDARDRLEEERDDLRTTNAELSERLEGLQAKVERLEAALERERARSLDVGSSGAGGGDEHVPPDRALSGTNLFVRYGTKSDATLSTAHDGDADRDAVASNLRLEHHTDFDAESVTVTGQAFEEFLASRMEYQFVDWLTETLLFEIRDTGHADDMADLYDVIPRIDRVELHATVSIEDDAEDVPDEVGFDVVAFDKMGMPLVVANLNDSREPASREMLVEMEEAASAIKANYPDFGAAMVVTSSYFDPGALEVAEEATAGGFLSRGSKQSYVTLSRKHGYHLCLVECRSGGFHMTVPEL